MTSEVRILLATYAKYFPQEKMLQVKEIFENLTEEQKVALSSLDFKDSTMALIISILVGSFGVDRFYIEDNMLGALKLLTCGGFAIWTIIDLFFIMNATKQKNLEKLMSIL